MSYKPRYLKRPLLYDLTFAAAVAIWFFWLGSHYSRYVCADKGLIEDSLSDLISTIVSLAGFVLAALTIIVALKGNVAHKDLSEQQYKIKQVNDDSEEDGEELEANELLERLGTHEPAIVLLFNSHYFKDIVKVFSSSLLIYLILYITLTAYRYFMSAFSSVVNISLGIFATLLVFLTAIRCLWVLYLVIKLQMESIKEE